MQTSLRSYIEKIEYNLKFDRIMRDRSRNIVKEFGLMAWFKKNPSVRNYHFDAVKTVRKNIPPDSTILETGCGIGQTFVILSRYGFKNFIGIEKDLPTYRAAKKFLSLYGISARLFCDDGLNTLKWVQEQSVDVYLPLNWTFETPELEKIFDIGKKVLKSPGLMIIDIIRKDFVPRSEKEERVYAKYTYRYSIDEVCDLVFKKNFQILAIGKKRGCRFNLYLKKI